tara:strand:+ start:2210 stop:2737 length:528 start_codon:yes stop_codon:yes gene_type:complete
MYFKALPNMIYPYVEDTGGVKKEKNLIVKDIFRRVHKDEFFNNRTNLIEYFLEDGETPELAAYNLYGSSEYHWILLICNDIVNPRTEWARSQRDLLAYTKNKYGTNNITSVHHYVNSTDTSIIEEWDATRLAGAEIQAVTNLQYEEDLNDKKRQIFYLHKNFLKDFIQQYKRLVE